MSELKSETVKVMDKRKEIIETFCNQSTTRCLVYKFLSKQSL